MISELLGILFMFSITLVLAIPLGRYIAKIYQGESTLLDPIFNPLEKLMYRICGIDTTQEMTWKQHLSALLTINLIWFLLSVLILMNQGWLPLRANALK